MDLPSGTQLIAEIAAYAVGTILMLGVWRWIRRRPDRHQKTGFGIFMRALAAPVSLLIGFMGLLQIVSAADTILLAEEIDVAPARTIILIVGIFWILLRLISAAERLYGHTIKFAGAEIDRSAVHAMFRVGRYAIIIIAALTAMESLGFSISGFLAFGGIGGAIVAFAAQKTLSNFFSGMIIFTERPFAAGDWIRCPGMDIEGVVEHIGWRTTQLRTFDQRPLYVPNAMFSDNVIENPQRMFNRRIYEHMGLRYEDIGKLPAILKEVRAMLAAHPDLDDKQIQMANFDAYADSSLNFFVYVMTRTVEWAEFHRVKEEVLLKIAEIVAAHGAEFAFPTRTIHMPASQQK